MEKSFVSYELALKLREKGFNEQCFASLSNAIDGLYFLKNHNRNQYEGDVYIISGGGSGFPQKAVSAPTYQQVVDWFNSKYNISIDTSSMYECDGYCFSYDFEIRHFVNHKISADNFMVFHNAYYEFNSRQEALSKAIEQALTFI